MSVETEAGAQLDKTRHSVDVAIGALAAIVVRQCHGSDEYNAVFTIAMRDLLQELMRIRDRLK